MDKVKTFVILGMHKSTTSLVAKALHEAGIHMGNEFLPKGEYEFYENKDFVQLNDRILAAAGGDQRNPPPHEDILKQDFSAEIKELIDKHQKPLWGWKDPRTTLTIDLYLPYLKDPHFIPIFRDPEKVAKRYKGDTSLAEEYNRRLINFLHAHYNSRE